MRSNTFFVLNFALCLWVMASVSPAHATSAEDFAQLPALSDISISPDGKHFAYIRHQSEQTMLVISEWPPGSSKKPPRLFSLGHKGQANWVEWANKRRLFVGLSRKESLSRGVPFTATYIVTVDLDSKKTNLLIRDRQVGQFNDKVLSYLPREPDYVLMQLDPDQFYTSSGYMPEAYKVNVNNGRMKLVKKGNHQVQQWFTDGRGNIRGGLGTTGIKDTYYLQILPAKTEQNPNPKWLFLKDLKGITIETSIFGFGDDPNTLLVGSNHETDTIALYKYDLETRQFGDILFHDEDVDISSVRYNRNGQAEGVVIIKDEPQTVYFEGEVEETAMSPQQIVEQRLPGYQIRLLTQFGRGEDVLFHSSAPDDSGAILRYQAEGQHISMIASLYPELSKDPLGLVISTFYRTRDRTKLQAIVTLPPSITETAQIKNLPFVILPHGGPHARDYKRFDYWAQFIASKGYGVLQMNFRGSTGFGKSFKEAGVGEWGTLMQNDIDDGTRWLVSKGYADPKRICIVGGSYGGYAALMGLIRSPELYACGVSLAGVTDLDNMIKDMRRYRGGGGSARRFVGKLWTDPQARKDNSPERLASKITKPLLLVHGEDDEVVHFDHFTRMRWALNKSTAEVTYIVLKDGDHHLSRYENRLAFLQGLGTFLDQNIGQPAVATADAGP